MSHKPGDSVEHWNGQHWNPTTVSEVSYKVVFDKNGIPCYDADGPKLAGTAVLTNGARVALDSRGESAVLRTRASTTPSSSSRRDVFMGVLRGTHGDDVRRACGIGLKMLEEIDQQAAAIQDLGKKLGDLRGSTGGGVSRIRELEAGLATANAEITRLRDGWNADAEKLKLKHDEASRVIKSHEASYSKWKAAEKKLQALALMLKAPAEPEPQDGVLVIEAKDIKVGDVVLEIQHTGGTWAKQSLTHPVTYVDGRGGWGYGKATYASHSWSLPICVRRGVKS